MEKAWERECGGEESDAKSDMKAVIWKQRQLKLEYNEKVGEKDEENWGLRLGRGFKKRTRWRKT